MFSRKPALGFIFVTLVLDVLGIGLIIPILPKLVESFHGGSVTAASHTYGLLAALYSLMQFLFAPLLGSLSDRFGRRTVILGSLFGSGLDYFVLAFAPNLGVAIALLLARFALSQMDVPTRQAYVMALVEPQERTAAAAYTNTARYVAARI